MARDRRRENAVDSGSSEEEESLSGGAHSSDSDSDEEPDLSHTVKKAAAAPLSRSQKLSSPSGDAESGSESESESDAPETAVVKLEASNPVDVPQKSGGGKKSKSMPKAVEHLTPAKPTGGKRKAEAKEDAAEKSKKLKPKPASEPESSAKGNLGSLGDSRRGLFKRLWSEEDEIVILKGMIDYESKNKSNPNIDLNAFYEIIKENLSVDGSRIQLQAKIRSLRRKYFNNGGKVYDPSEGLWGKRSIFSKPHEREVYELSEKLWGKDKRKETESKKTVQSTKSNGGASSSAPIKKLTLDAEEVQNVDVSYGKVDVFGKRKLVFSGETMEEKINRLGTEMFERNETADPEREREWNKLKLEEIELHLKKLDLVRAKIKLLLKASSK